jgi:gas vesicle protein
MIPLKGAIMFGKKTAFTKFAFIFGAGLITGTVLGLLYAPMTGKKLQKKVASVTDKVIDKVDDLQQTVRKIANA